MWRICHGWPQFVVLPIVSVKDEIDDDSQTKLPYLHPPVFIVGTHADKPVDDIAEMKSKFRREFLARNMRSMWCDISTALTTQIHCPNNKGSRCSNVTAKSQGAAAGVNLMKSDMALKVTLLASECSSSMGGLSTINRQLAILLAKHSQVDVTLLVPQFACSEEERRMASRHNVSLREAHRLLGYTDPLDWLSAPPRDLAIGIVLGHGAKLGEEKNTTEVELCELTDAVVAVGPKLTKAYSSYLCSCEKHQNIIQLTPSTFSEFSDVKQAVIDMEKFKVITFGRGDPEDFSLKGYDICARAIVELRDRSCHLIFVGAPDGKQDEVAANLLKSGIDKSQLTVRKTEGFGLAAVEALSAGLPILVSGNSGFGEAFSTVPSGKSFVVESEDPKEWAKAIAPVQEKESSDRLHENEQLKTSYEEKFSWEKV
ncbi:hypothetical protein AWC38_SpisGene21702 [Stylophora pistillata]|uniref:Uncharacterized protein n=1 Tax=Stylophora pistillata TaxID=50429 RepID=A0A2B4R742_STYPI|nr:hypothetical protein AWC38_SpisGene21702 [Stylophora pistillata]